MKNETQAEMPRDILVAWNGEKLSTMQVYLEIYNKEMHHAKYLRADTTLTPDELKQVKEALEYYQKGDDAAVELLAGFGPGSRIDEKSPARQVLAILSKVGV